MNQPIKLYSAIDAVIKPGATVTIPVNEEINVPLTAVGKFFVRLQLGEQGITPPDAQFRPGFSGKPKKGIVLINAGANPVDIVKGREIGEVYLLALWQRNAFHVEIEDLPPLNDAMNQHVKEIKGSLKLPDTRNDPHIHQPNTTK